jgi:hypothetical protein
MSKYTINVHATRNRGPLPVKFRVYDSFVSLEIGDVSFFLDSVADAADLSERITVAVSAAMVDPTVRLRTARDSERIVMQSADEWDAQS